MASGTVSYSGEFLLALERTLRWEGRYSDSPQDPGGETYCGISRRNWPEWEGWALVPAGGDVPASAEPALTDAVRAFYWTRVWQPLAASQWGKPGLAEDGFDAAVNLGVAAAVKCLQNALGLPPAQQDGVVGPKTLAAIQAAPSSLVDTFIAYRVMRYARIIAADPRLGGFAVSWLRRAVARWLGG